MQRLKNIFYYLQFKLYSIFNILFRDYLLVLLILFHFFSNLIWILLDNSLPGWDEIGHTLITLDYVSLFKRLDFINFFTISDYYPPLIHIISSIFMLSGLGPKSNLIVINLFFTLAIVFLYLYSKLLLEKYPSVVLINNKFTAFLIAFLFSFLPVIYALSREFLLEIPLISLSLITLYLWEKSQSLTISKYSKLFFVFLGLTALTKWVGLIYLIIPILLTVKKNIHIKNLIYGIGLFLLITAPWYLTNLFSILQRVRVSILPEAVDPQNLFSIQNLVFYFSNIINFQLTWWGVILLIFAIIFVFRMNRKIWLICLVNIIYIYLIFTFVPNKDFRYIILILPFASILIVLFFSIFLLTKRILSLILLIISAVYFGFYYFSLSFGFPLNPKTVNYQKAVKLPLIGWVDYINLGKDTSQYLAPTFVKESWPNTQIIRWLLNTPKKDLKILILVDKRELNAKNLELTKRENNFKGIDFWAPYDFGRFEDIGKLEAYLAYFDYALIPEKSFGPEGALRHIEVLKQLKEHINNVSSEDETRITKVKDFNLPDGDKLLIYEIKI